MVSKKHADKIIYFYPARQAFNCVRISTHGCARFTSDRGTCFANQAFTHTPAITDIIPTNTAIPTDTAVPVAQGASVSFANDIQPLLKSRCGNCHGGNKTEEGLNLLTYASRIQGSDNGLVVNAGLADNSLLVEQIVSQEMPKRGPKLTPPQVQLIVDWINQGTLNN